MTLAHAITTGLTALGLSFLASACFAQGAPSVRGDVVVAGETVLLGDIVTDAGPAAGAAVFRAPAPGRSGTIQISRVLEAAAAAGVTGVDAASLSRVVITRSARRIEKRDIEAALATALARQGLDSPEVTVTLENDESALFVERDAAGELIVSRLAYDPRTQRLEAELSVAGSRSMALRPARIVASVLDSVEAPVLVRAVQKGDAIHPADLRFERRARRDAPQGLATTAMLAGRVVKSGLPAGTILREADLARQIVVEKGSAVQVVFETAGLALSMRGKALENGGVGDVVLVQNLQSKRNLQGIVTAPGQVSVNLAPPGRVASAASATTPR